MTAFKKTTAEESTAPLPGKKKFHVKFWKSPEVFTFIWLKVKSDGQLDGHFLMDGHTKRKGCILSCVFK